MLTRTARTTIRRTIDQNARARAAREAAVELELHYLTLGNTLPTEHPVRLCPECLEPFAPRTYHQTYDTPACRKRANSRDKKHARQTNRRNP